MSVTETVPLLSAWLLNEAKSLPVMDVVIDGLCERLNAAGVPIDRAIVSTNTLHAVHLSYYRLWQSDGAHVSDTYDRDEVHLGYFDRSPLRVIAETGQPVELRLAETPDDAYGIVPDLKREGYTHYLAVPLRFSDGVNNQLTWSTKRASGFTADDIAVLRGLEPALSAALEIRMLRRAMVETLQTYLGDEPGRRVAHGAIVRGEVSEIEAAILFADLRGFTASSTHLNSDVLVRLLNEYYACLIPAVERQGGDVLKLIGDGMLAIFPDADGDAPQRAYAAACEAQAAIAEANARGSDWPELAAGIALHHGTAAYGNIGSVTRLDFTVIGRDVNLASRICGMCREAGAPVLMSAAFCDRLAREAEEVGAFPLRGIAEPMMLYRPL